MMQIKCVFLMWWEKAECRKENSAIIHPMIEKLMLGKDKEI